MEEGGVLIAGKTNVKEITLNSSLICLYSFKQEGYAFYFIDDEINAKSNHSSVSLINFS